MSEIFRVLVINPGSTSTKLALYDDKELLIEEELSHSTEDLKGFKRVFDEKKFRADIVKEFLSSNDIPISTLSGIAGRGGVLKPIAGGSCYRVNEKMINDLAAGKYGEHASNLGALIADEISKENDIPAFILDPVVVDEMFHLARYSGLPELPRKSILHALNQKAVAREYATSIGKKYDQVNLIVAHLGGGISVGAHKKSLVVDVNNALNGDGPFTPERSGGLPVQQLAELCFSGEYKLDEIKKMIKGKGGVAAYLGTNDLRLVENRALEGDEKYYEVLEAMTYQIAKEICFLIPAFQGEEIDAVIVTGGAARAKFITDRLIKWLKPSGLKVVIAPGEREMTALRDGVLRVLSGEDTEKIYE